MEEKKFSVLPESNDKMIRISEEQKQEMLKSGISENEIKAAKEMERRTEEQLKLRQLQNEIKYTDEKYIDKDAKYQAIYEPQPKQKGIPENKAYSEQLAEISKPQMNHSWDIVKLPSLGKLYPSKKHTVKVAYLTTSDEDIMTSPNLLESGDFLEVIINRKLLEEDIRYKDLLPADRDAIMIWLRGTGYGTMYSVKINDEDGKPFDAEVDLSQLNIKYLEENPNENGYFEFILPSNNKVLEFKLLTLGDLERLEKLVEFLKQEKGIINKESTLLLREQIVSVDGNTDKEFLDDYVENMRLLDSKKLLKHIESISFGVDTKLKFKTPGGGSVTRFLPFTTQFFWPDFEL